MKLVPCVRSRGRRPVRPPAAPQRRTGPARRPGATGPLSPFLHATHGQPPSRRPRLPSSRLPVATLAHQSSGDPPRGRAESSRAALPPRPGAAPCRSPDLGSCAALASLSPSALRASTPRKRAGPAHGCGNAGTHADSVCMAGGIGRRAPLGRRADESSTSRAARANCCPRQRDATRGAARGQSEPPVSSAPDHSLSRLRPPRHFSTAREESAGRDLPLPAPIPHNRYDLRQVVPWSPVIPVDLVPFMTGGDTRQARGDLARWNPPGGEARAGVAASARLLSPRDRAGRGHLGRLGHVGASPWANLPRGLPW